MALGTSQEIQEGTIERRLRACPTTRTKAKGRVSLETPPFLFRFSEIRFGLQITTPVIPESFGTHERQPVFFPHSSVITLTARAFPTVVRFQLRGPKVSLPILEGRRQSALSFWKITPPLKAILLSSNGNASGSVIFCCGNGVTKSGNWVTSPPNVGCPIQARFWLEWGSGCPSEPSLGLSRFVGVS